MILTEVPTTVRECRKTKCAVSDPQFPYHIEKNHNKPGDHLHKIIKQNHHNPITLTP